MGDPCGNSGIKWYLAKYSQNLDEIPILDDAQTPFCLFGFWWFALNFVNNLFDILFEFLLSHIYRSRISPWHIVLIRHIVVDGDGIFNGSFQGHDGMPVGDLMGLFWPTIWYLNVFEHWGISLQRSIFMGHKMINRQILGWPFWQSHVAVSLNSRLYWTLLSESHGFW